jgi:hypothetical protein
MDTVTAFLTGELEEDIYMRQLLCLGIKEHNYAEEVPLWPQTGSSMLEQMIISVRLGSIKVYLIHA